MEDRQLAIELIAEAVANGARRVRACESLGLSLRTLQRWESSDGGGDQRRGPLKGPQNALSEAERALVVAIASSPMFRDLAPSQIVPILADAGVYVASESSFYRILREAKLVNHRGRAAAAKYRGPTEHVATGANQVWSWDITYLKSPVKGQFYYLYLVVDVWSRKIVGWAVHEVENTELAAALIRVAIMREGVAPEALVLHSDNGGPMKGATMLATLQWLGVIPSFSRPRVCDDNPYSEALFRTVKYRPEYPQRPFESLEDARGWVEWFVGWYNDDHRHSGIQFVTPSQRHSGAEREILSNREEVYRQAREENPCRWSGATRDWKPIETVVLNPAKRGVEKSEVDRTSA
jgi:transposase InsO family protein